MSHIWAIMCASGGYQDLLWGFLILWPVFATVCTRLERNTCQKPFRKKNCEVNLCETVYTSNNFDQTTFWDHNLAPWRILDLGKWQYIHFLIRNPMFRSKVANCWWQKGKWWKKYSEKWLVTLALLSLSFVEPVHSINSVGLQGYHIWEARVQFFCRGIRISVQK